MVENLEEIKTAKKGYAAYMREWRHRNPDKVKKSLVKYWAKKARELEKIDSK